MPKRPRLRAAQLDRSGPGVEPLLLPSPPTEHAFSTASYIVLTVLQTLISTKQMFPSLIENLSAETPEKLDWKSQCGNLNSSRAGTTPVQLP